jgi:spore germination protein KC
MKSSVKNGLPKLSVNLHAEENIGEVQCQLDITKVEVIQELEQQASKTLVKIIKDTIRAAQNKYKTDFLGFGNVVHRSSPGAWKDLQSDWDEVFADTDVDVSATVNINRTGTVNNSFMKEAEE